MENTFNFLTMFFAHMFIAAACLLLEEAGATDRQQIQFSKVVPYNSSYQCNGNASFTESVFDKIPKLQSILDYNITNIQQYNLSGSWALYYEENYEGRVVLSSDVNCLKQSEVNSPPYKSMQFMGNSDGDSLGLSFFPGDGGTPSPHGKEWFTDAGIFSLSAPLCVAYWASTGATNWTVFSNPGFTGPSECLSTRKNSKYGQGSLPYVHVGSGYPGCNLTSTPALNSCAHLWTTPPVETTTSSAPPFRYSHFLLILTALTALVSVSTLTLQFPS